MAMRWSYVGELGSGGRLDWGGQAGGNIPVAGLLPDIHDTSLYLWISRLAAEGKYSGKTIDFDACGLKVNGQDLKAVIEQCYFDRPAMLQSDEIAQYLAYADSLPPSKFVALVAVAMRIFGDLLHGTRRLTIPIWSVVVVLSSACLRAASLVPWTTATARRAPSRSTTFE